MLKSYSHTTELVYTYYAATGYFGGKWTLVDATKTGTERVWVLSNASGSLGNGGQIKYDGSMWQFYTDSGNAQGMNIEGWPYTEETVFSPGNSLATTFTPVTTGGETALFTVPAGSELAVVSIQIYGGTTGGDLTLTRNDGTGDVFSATFTVGANVNLILDHKQFFESGHSLKVDATAAGLQICVNASLEEGV